MTDHRFSIAPMMEWTDRHCRFFHRLLTRRARLYTEMITTGAVLRGDRARLLGFDPAEHPVAVQLGGSDPRALAECGAHLRRPRLRRDQSQCRLPVRPGAGRALRRLPDGGARAGRRMRRRHEGRGARSGHGEVPHRHRRPGPGRVARHAHPHGGRGRRRRADRACAQGLARRAVAEGKPRHPAARLRPRLSAQARLAGAARRDQWRHRERRAGGRASRAPRRRDDGPRRLSGAVAAARRRSADLRRAGAVRVAEGRRSRRSSPMWSASLRAARGCMP